MYKETPWTTEEKTTKKSRVRKSSYIKERQADLAVSTARVLKLFEIHKDKAFNTAQVAEALDISEGTASSILNRLVTLGDKVVVSNMQRPHWAPVYQHIDTAPQVYTFTYTKEDSILKILKTFKKDVNAVYTKDELLKKLGCSEGMLLKSLQVLLLKGDISYVGNENGKAKYQHKDGNIEGIEVSCEPDDRYVRFGAYLEEKKLKSKYDDIKKVLTNVKTRLFYSNKGLAVEYLKEDLDKAVEKMTKKKFLGLF